jgi:putative DNA primase/helicase
MQPEDNVIPMSDYQPPSDGGATPPPTGEGARKKRRPKPVDLGSYSALMECFTLIYPTETAWDSATRRVVTLRAMRARFGTDPVKGWLNSPHRRMCLAEELMFEPGREIEPPAINLFDGLAMQPRKGDFAPILELLQHLCAESADTPEGCAKVCAWALRWLALPLQRPGVKMRSAMVFHGPQGAGKNLLFEIVAKIYGSYALVVGQDQLEDKFNDWASQKLFLIGDEVVAKAELYHQKNKLKAFITGETIQINAKMLPLRTEANHVNVVFLSNDMQPLALEPGDRRYFVVYTPPRREDDLYTRVARCMANGGTEAFYAYLLSLPMLEFNEFEIPPMTAAKADLIALGLKPHERFVREWSEGYLPLPRWVCSTEQLFRAFRRWCAQTGERFIPNQITFSKGVEKAGRGKLRGDAVKLDTEVNGKSWLRVWVHGDAGPPDGVGKGQWAREAIEAFEDALRRFGEQQADGGAPP